MESLLCGREKKDESVREVGRGGLENVGDSAVARLSEARLGTCYVTANGLSLILAYKLRGGRNHACGGLSSIPRA